MPLPMLVCIVFLVSTSGIVGLYMLVAGRSHAALRRTVDHRLLELSGGGAIAEDGGSLLRIQKTGPLPSVDRAVKGLHIDQWLEQSGLKLSLSALMVFTIVLGVVGLFVAAQFTHRAPLVALGFVVGAAMPFLFVRYKRNARLNRFEEHFPEALDLISRAIRAGHAFGAGLKMVADELGDPVGPEFRKTFEEQNFGLPLTESLNNLAHRVPLLDIRFFATAVLIQRETGGNLSEILDNLAAVVRERFKIRRQIRVHTAHGRFTGYVLLGLPAFLGIALSMINPEHMDMLFNDRMGHMLIVAAIVMQIIGWFWITRVIKIEV
jgi:tight adherence protein B